MEDDQNLVADEAVAETGAPDWVPEKFRSNPEKFAEAYTNLEREFHSTKQQNRALEDNYTALAAQVEELQAQPRADQNDLRSQLYEQYENDPIQTVALLANQAAQQAVEQYAKQAQSQFQPAIQNQQSLAAEYAYGALKQANPDVDNFRTEIAEFIQQNPHYVPQDHLGNPQQLAQDLDNVYKIVSRDTAVTSATQLAEQAANAERMKLQAQSMSGASGRLPATPQDEADWEKVRAAAKGGW